MNGTEDDEPTVAAYYLVRVSEDFEPVRHALVSSSCTGLLAWLYRTGDSLLVVHYQGASPTIVLFDPWTLERQGSLPLIPGLQVPVTNVENDVTMLLERNHLSFHIPKVPSGMVDEPEEDGFVPFISGLCSPRSICAYSPDTWARPLFVKQYDGWTLKAVSDRFRRNARVAASAQASRSLDRVTEHIAETGTPHALLELFWKEPDATAGDRFFHEGAERAVSFSPEDPKTTEWLELALGKSQESYVKAHLLHLLGLAHLAAGRRVEAVASWVRASRIDDKDCPVGFLLAIMGGLERTEVEKLLPGVPQPAFVWDHAERYERAVLAMGRLDEAIDAGRGEDAWKEARRVRELVGPSWQLSARVALLHLDHPDPNTDPWRYQLDLAWMASQAWLGPTRNHMIFAGHHWDHHRFTEITTRAGEVLDAMGVGVANRRTGATLEAEARNTEPGNTEPGNTEPGNTELGNTELGNTEPTQA